MDVAHGCMPNMNLMVLELNVDIAFFVSTLKRPAFLKIPSQKSKVAKMQSQNKVDAFREADQKL